MKLSWFSAFLGLVLTFLGGCDPTETASKCAESDLIAQCPAGSNPVLGAEASMECGGKADADLIWEEGSVTAQCHVQGECHVLCNFSVPCVCGVDRITKDEIVCSSCENQSCGDSRCEGTERESCNPQQLACQPCPEDCSGANCGDGDCTGDESPQTCPEDCATLCTPNSRTCIGTILRVCSSDGDSYTDFDCAESVQVCHNGECITPECGNGFCEPGEIQCPDCTVECPGKECGPADQPGMNCGFCPGRTDYCTADGHCEDDCAGRECGPSPNAGHDCGSCSMPNEACNPDGQCVDDCLDVECGLSPNMAQDCGLCPGTYLQDGFSSGLGQWICGGEWGLTNTTFHSPATSLTDTPGGNYIESADSGCRLAAPVNISTSSWPTLTFYHRYNLGGSLAPPYHDTANVEVSEDGGFTWSILRSYTESQNAWGFEQLDLSEYKGGSISVRFRLNSIKGSPGADGWYIDDVQIKELTSSCQNCDGETDWCNPQGQCVDDCEGRECGPSPNAGYDCGTCMGLTDWCDPEGQCIDDCEGIDCGSSPNAGYDCGTCTGATDWCDTEGQCIDDCEDRECGPSFHAGLDCGTCPQETDWCNLEGQCEANGNGILSSDGFESGMGNWWVDNGMWEVGIPTCGPMSAYSGSNVAGTVLDGDYPDNTSSRLVSPSINLPSIGEGIEIQLDYWQWFVFDAYDNGTVQVSAEISPGTWSNWITVATVKFAGGPWTRGGADLSAFAGSKVRIGWQCNTQSSGGWVGVAAGWYLDDIAVSWRPTDVLREDDGRLEGFENGLGSWSIDNGMWEVGTPSYGPPGPYAGSNSAGTVLSGDYPDNTTSRLISPAVVLPAIDGGDEIQLLFWHWFVFDHYDNGVLQIAEELSRGVWSEWVALVTYQYSSGSWTRSAVDISGYAGKKVRIGWQCNTQSSGGWIGVAAGWYVDDVSLVLVEQ